MNVEVRLSEDDIERIARRVVELQGLTAPKGEAWLTAAQAGAHLGMSEHAIRGLVKRKQIPVHRTESGRVRFSPRELDDWVHSSCAE